MSHSTDSCDILILGGGIMGLCLALEGRRRHPDASITLIDKEPAPGVHASGRNSGVLHAGFYYGADSLKARFTLTGNRALTAYCQERGLPINRCGKLVVARHPGELAGLAELHRRGVVNGVPVELVDARQAQELEPRARTAGQALWSPETAVVDPRAVMASLARDAEAAGIRCRWGCPYQGRDGERIHSGGGTIRAGYVINAAGLQADRIARGFGFSQGFAILPFKGLYLYGEAEPGLLRRHIYPVPDLDYPFLGVHYTLTVNGGVKIGPTAIPALWREHYGGWHGFQPREAWEIITREAALWWRNAFGFRTIAWQELQKYRQGQLVRLAAQLADTGNAIRRWRWGPPGIRAQLMDLERRQLVTDFHWEGDRHSFHVLNAVSPGFTCAMPFSAYLWQRIEERMGAASPSRAGAALSPTGG